MSLQSKCKPYSYSPAGTLPVLGPPLVAAPPALPPLEPAPSLPLISPRCPPLAPPCAPAALGPPLIGAAFWGTGFFFFVFVVHSSSFFFPSEFERPFTPAPEPAREERAFSSSHHLVIVSLITSGLEAWRSTSRCKSPRRASGQIG